MIFILIGIVIGLSLAWSILEDCYDLGEYVMGIIFTCLVVFMGFLVGGLIAMGIGFIFNQQPTLDKNIQLAALQDNTGISGSFFLGSGTIGSKPVYYYLEKRTDGGFVQKSIETENVIVYEDNGTPHMETYTSDFTNPYSAILGIPGQDWPTKIYIPKGSIKKDYKIDLTQ